MNVRAEITPERDPTNKGTNGWQATSAQLPIALIIRVIYDLICIILILIIFICLIKFLLNYNINFYKK